MADLYSDVLEVSITASGWSAVTLPSGTSAKAFTAKCRDNSSFLLSNESDGDGYITIPLSLSEEISSVGAGSTLFYVKGTTTTTLEVLLREK